MTVDSQNIEAVSSRTKPVLHHPRNFAESVLSCPKCGNAMEPLLLGKDASDGSQKVWWTCSEVKNKKCVFPLDMPDNIFWVKRTAQDIEKDEVPPPDLSSLPISYQHLYPSLFQYSRKTIHGSRQGSHESTRSISSGPSDSACSSNSAWDVDDNAKIKTAIKLDAMKKPKVVLTQRRTFIPSLTGSRAQAFAESFQTHATHTSTSIATRVRCGNVDKKTDEVTRDEAKKRVIQMLSKMSPAQFKNIESTKVKHMKQAVIEHVKKRRAEREQIQELQRLTQKRKVLDVDDLIKEKLKKNKMEYEQRRKDQAQAARAQAAKRSRMAWAESAGAFPSMPGYEEEEDDEQMHQQPPETAAYAVTPPYMPVSSPRHSESFYHEYGSFPNEYSYIGDDFADMSSSSSAMDHSAMDNSAMDHSAMDSSAMDHSAMDNSDDSSFNAVSPFAELGVLTEDDLEGIINDPTFEDTFAQAFGDQFGDIADYN